MSTELRANRKKRTPDATSSDVTPEGDHRKRRRNRTTQSCLNCHTSKRMCDRKRPCGRCTQLGLTGLCVYEIDDPSRQNNAQDESSRLRQRVAELEGVIRELKNKPPPRWTKSGASLDEEFEKCHARARSCSASQDSVAETQPQSGLSCLSLANSSAGTNEESLGKKTPPLVNDTLQPEYLSHSLSSPATASSILLSNLPYSPCFDTHSTASAPSTGIVTPTEEPLHQQITIADGQQLTSDIDLASLFMSYPDLLVCDEGLEHVENVLQANTHNQHIHLRSMKYDQGQFLDGHCGCLNEFANYNVVLELSLRLRKAADILSHAANHRFNNGCPLNQEIVDLDSLATTALGNITTPPNNFGTVHLRSRANTVPSRLVPPTFPAMNRVPIIRAPAISPPSTHGLRSWNVSPCASDPSAPCDESFIGWEPSHWG